MKPFIILIAFFLAFDFGFAESNDSVTSLKFVEEAQDILRTMRASKETEVNWFINRFLELFSEDFTEFESVKKRLGDKLNTLGDEGKSLNIDFQNNISSLFNSSSSNVCSALFKSEVGIKIIYRIVGKYSNISDDSLRNDTGTVKTAINANRNADRCWRRDIFIAIVNKLFETIRSNVDQKLSELKDNVGKIVNETTAFTQEIEEELNGFGSDEESALNYVKVQFPSIIGNYTEQSKRFDSLSFTIIVEVTNAVKSNVNVADISYESSRDAVFKCLQEDETNEEK